MTVFRTLAWLAAASLGAMFAATSAQAAFPNLTTIYIVSGVRDNGAATDQGVATVLHCSNVSGQAVSVRVITLSRSGATVSDRTTTLANGATKTFSTHLDAYYSTDVDLATGSVSQGAFNVEATNPAVFCTAMSLLADTPTFPFGSKLHMVRVNPLSGTQE